MVKVRLDVDFSGSVETVWVKSKKCSDEKEKYANRNTVRQAVRTQLPIYSRFFSEKKSDPPRDDHI